MLLQLWTVAALVAIVKTEQGSCPPTLAVDLRDAECGPAKPCNNTQLCCPTWQGGSMCVDPVTRRHFTTLVKKGRCPANSRGAWICTDSCTGDSDCVRALKCCRNRCGALTCQKPDLEPETTVPTPTTTTSTTTTSTTTTLAPVLPDEPLYNPEPYTSQPEGTVFNPEGFVPNREETGSNLARPTFNPMDPFFPAVPMHNPSGSTFNNWGSATFPANSLLFPAAPGSHPTGSRSNPGDPNFFPALPGGPMPYPSAPTLFPGFSGFYFTAPTSSRDRPEFRDFFGNNRDASASRPRSNNRISWPDNNHF